MHNLIIDFDLQLHLYKESAHNVTIFYSPRSTKFVENHALNVTSTDLFCRN